MPPKSKVGLGVNWEVPVTYLIGCALALSGFCLTQYMRLSAIERTNSDQDKTIERNAAEHEKSLQAIRSDVSTGNKETRDLRDRIIALQTTMDGVARMIAVQTTIDKKNSN